MKFLKTLAKALIPAAIAAVQPEALVNNAVLGVVKHGTKVNNQAIPGINLLLSTGVAYLRNGDFTPAGLVPALQEGVGLATASTAIHQTGKIALRAKLGSI